MHKMKFPHPITLLWPLNTVLRIFRFWHLITWLTIIGFTFKTSIHVAQNEATKVQYKPPPHIIRSDISRNKRVQYTNNFTAVPHTIYGHIVCGFVRHCCYIKYCINMKHTHLHDAFVLGLCYPESRLLAQSEWFIFVFNVVQRDCVYSTCVARYRTDGDKQIYNIFVQVVRYNGKVWIKSSGWGVFAF